MANPIDTTPRYETDEFVVSLREVATVSRTDGDITLFVFEIKNVSDGLIEWSADDHVFVDDEGFQHEPAGLVTTDEETEPSPFDDGPSGVQVSDELNRSVSVVPGAKALGVASVRLPPGKALQSVVCHPERGENYELPLSESARESLSATVGELGFEHERATKGDESSEQEAVGSLAESDNFQVELSDIVTDLPEQNSNLVILVFEVTNTSSETTTWWYDEHIFIDSEGYRLTEAEQVTGLLSDSPALSDEYETNPDVPPESTAKCYTDVHIPADRHLAEIHYEYEEDQCEIHLDDKLWEQLTVSHEEFTEGALADEVVESISGMIVEESPETTYGDIGGLEEQKRKVRETIGDSLVDSERFEALGLSPPEGVLLQGPPGTGKTMLARAVANHSEATFITLTAPELARAYLGEGEKLVRACFEYARNNQPAIIFIDEIDGIAATRREGVQGAEREVYRTMLQLLSQMDGFESSEDVRVLAATNRPDLLDPALLRPGRFDRVIEVPKPDHKARISIFKKYIEGMETAGRIDIDALAQRTDGMTGADIEAICTEAGHTALRGDREQVTQEDFVDAIASARDELKPSDLDSRAVY